MNTQTIVNIAWYLAEGMSDADGKLDRTAWLSSDRRAVALETLQTLTRESVQNDWTVVWGMVVDGQKPLDDSPVGLACALESWGVSFEDVWARGEDSE